jgi:hypothetical protein
MMSNFNLFSYEFNEDYDFVYRERPPINSQTFYYTSSKTDNKFKIFISVRPLRNGHEFPLPNSKLAELYIWNNRYSIWNSIHSRFYKAVQTEGAPRMNYYNETSFLEACTQDINFLLNLASYFDEGDIK